MKLILKEGEAQNVEGRWPRAKVGNDDTYPIKGAQVPTRATTQTKTSSEPVCGYPRVYVYIPFSIYKDPSSTKHEEEQSLTFSVPGHIIHVLKNQPACCYAGILLRGGIVNGTYGMHKNLPGMYLTIFINNIGSHYLWSPVIECTYIYPSQNKNPSSTNMNRSKALNFPSPVVRHLYS